MSSLETASQHHKSQP